MSGTMPSFMDGTRDQLTESNGRVRVLPTNVRKVKVDGRDVKTKWQEGRLISKSTAGEAKVTEVYERSPNGALLIVTATVDMRGREVSARRVYDAVTQ